MASTPRNDLSGNPLKYDPELKTMLEKLDSINSYRSFRRWKGSFLRRFESFLKQAGIQPAEESYRKFSSNMEKFEKKVNQVQGFIDKGDISTQRTSVKGRNSLNEMTKTTTEVIQELEELIPSNSTEEKKKRYNKYHLGVVLVRDGFSEYERMCRCDDLMQAMIDEKKDGALLHAADKQQKEEIEHYTRKLQRFRDVMNDLGLYEVMLKSRQFAGGDIDEIIFLDPKTGSIIEMPRQKCFDEGILGTFIDANGNEKIREEETSRAEKQELYQTIKTVFKI